MSLTIPDFVGLLDGERKELRHVTTPQLHSQKRRDALRILIEGYFKEIRPQVIADSSQTQEVSSIDGSLQELLLLCHKHGSVKKYINILNNARAVLIKLDARLVTSYAPVSAPHVGDTIDASIIRTLTSIVPSAAFSYEQALYDLQADTRLSWRGPATDLREALRETLDYLAPDAEVKGMAGFKLEPDTDGPTMKQKVRYVLKNRGVAKATGAPAEAATEAIDSAVGSFVRSVYTRSNVSTHTPTDKNEVLRVRDFVRVVLCELLEIRS